MSKFAIYSSSMLLFLLMLSGYVFGALGALVFGRGALGRGLSALSVLSRLGAGFGAGQSRLWRRDGCFGFPVPLFLPLTGFALRLDGLSAFFLIIIGLVGLPRSRLRLRLFGRVRGPLFPADARRDAQRAVAVAERAGDGRQRADLSHRLGSDVALGLLAGADRTRPARRRSRRRTGTSP